MVPPQSRPSRVLPFTRNLFRSVSGTCAVAASFRNLSEVFVVKARAIVTNR
jgi:hypothetical protein